MTLAPPPGSAPPPESTPPTAAEPPQPEPSPPALVPAAPSRWPRGVQALAHRNFRLFWLGQLVSLVGTWMQQVAQGWLVLELTNDPVALGITTACQFVPVTVFGLFGGLVGDTVPKRTTLFVAHAFALALALALGLLVLSGRVEVWHVWLLAALLGLVNAVEMPVRQAFVVEMVGRDAVPNAVALNSAVFNGSRIVGPALAGLTIGVAGLAACSFVNAASYVAVLVMLAAMRSSELLPVARAQFQRSVRGILAQIGDGLRYTRRTPMLLLPIAVLGVVATFGMNFGVLMPVLARDVLGGGPDLFGFLMAASGIGSLTAALSIAFGVRPTLRLLVTGAAVFGLALVGLALSRSVPVSLVLMAVLGWGLIAMAATTNTLVQLNVPDELRGRVMSIYTTVFAGSTPVGGLFSGVIAGLAGAPAALLAGGIISTMAALVAATRVPQLARAAARQTRPRTG